MKEPDIINELIHFITKDFIIIISNLLDTDFRKKQKSVKKFIESKKFKNKLSKVGSIIQEIDDLEKEQISDK